MGKPPPTFKSAILREIAEIIGADSTLKLAKAVGGTRVYIPATVHAGHWLAQTIGIDAAQKLAAHFAFETFNPRSSHDQAFRSGMRIEIPLPQSKYDDSSRAAELKLSSREAALTLGVTQRTIHRRRRRSKGLK